MFHAEGKAGFDLGYIEGFADGRARIAGNSATADGRASLRFHPPDISWPERLDPSNYHKTSDEWIPTRFIPPRFWEHLKDVEAKEAEKMRGSNITNKRVYGGHSSVVSTGVGRNMYGFRRGYRRRVFRRRSVYRRRRFY